MPGQAEVRRRGRVFDEHAEGYDRHRPGYPDALIDRACEQAGLARGDEVLELGCGTGQLTRSLLARGMRVTAVEPGERLIALARDRLDGLGEVQFICAALEHAVLPSAHYAAVFCASAIHWIDPDVSWRIAAEVLREGAGLALVSYFGLADPRSDEDQRAIRAAMQAIAPEHAAQWPTYRDLDGMLAGVATRRGNISEVWAWLGNYAVARGYAASLFGETQFLALPALREHSAEEINALLATMSFWADLSLAQRDALAGANRALAERLGRPIRSGVVACLALARRRPRI